MNVSVSSLVDRATKQLGLKHRYSAENSSKCKFSDHDIELIRELHDEGLTLTDIADKFDASVSYVSALVNFKARLVLTAGHV